MNLSLIILAVVGLVAFTNATATHRVDYPNDDSPENPLIEGLRRYPSSSPLIRHKRFTCDLLSFSADGVSGFNHAACAAKCLAKRHWGGHCDGPNCKCVEKKW